MKKKRLLLAAALGMCAYKMMEYRNKPAAHALKAKESCDCSVEQSVETKIEAPKATLARENFYYTAGGAVYHRNRDCMYLKKSSTVSVGTAAQACAAGKTRACSRCGE